MVIGLEVHCELRPPPSCSAVARTCSATSPTPTCARPVSACPARCRCSTAKRSSSPCASAPRSTARSCRRRSTGRTTSIRTCRRTIRSVSTTSRSTSAATSICPTASASASRAPTSKKTPARPRTSAATAASTARRTRWSTTTAPACRWSRSCREPDMRTVRAGPRLRQPSCARILVATGASDGRMEEGSMRVDANVSVRRSETDEFGTRCEIKNVNSIRSLGRAIEYEARRQIDLIEAGEKVIQQTRHWNEDEGRTITGRVKEDADDYRYFLEPDLVPLAPTTSGSASVRAEPRGVAGGASRRGGRAPPVPSRRRWPWRRSSTSTSTTSCCAAVEAGADGRIALARAANEVAADVEAGRALDVAAFATLVEDGVGRRTHRDAGQDRARSSCWPRRWRSQGHRGQARVRGDGHRARSTRSSTRSSRRTRTSGSATATAIRRCTGFFVGQVMKATGGQGRRQSRRRRAAARAAKALSALPLRVALALHCSVPATAVDERREGAHGGDDSTTAASDGCTNPSSADGSPTDSAGAATTRMPVRQRPAVGRDLRRPRRSTTPSPSHRASTTTPRRAPPLRRAPSAAHPFNTAKPTDKQWTVTYQATTGRVQRANYAGGRRDARRRCSCHSSGSLDIASFATSDIRRRGRRSFTPNPPATIQSRSGWPRVRTWSWTHRRRNRTIRTAECRHDSRPSFRVDRIANLRVGGQTRSGRGDRSAT